MYTLSTFLCVFKNVLTSVNIVVFYVCDFYNFTHTTFFLPIITNYFLFYLTNNIF